MRLLFVLVSLFSLSAQAYMASYSDLVGADLLRRQAIESRTHSLDQINIANETTLQIIETHQPSRVVNTQKGQRLNAVSKEWAIKAMRSINKHPVVSSYQYSQYNRQPNVEIGFCFGRAAYAHLALLKMGVNKDAIKKVWAVGPMSNGVNWQFHVSTLVKAENDTWWAVDNFPGQVLNIRDWFYYMKPMNTDGKLRIYITNPEKFSVSLGEYSRVQMGLDLSRNQDWYSHYFVDLMNWFRISKNALESVGLLDLRTLVKDETEEAPESNSEASADSDTLKL